MPTSSQEDSPLNETDPETSIPSPNVIRTRSGRSLRTPAAIQKSEVPCLKTTSCRPRKSGLRKPTEEVPAENTDTDTAPSLESVHTDSATSPSEPEGHQVSVLCGEIALNSDQSGEGTADTRVSIDTLKSNRKTTKHSQTCEKGGRMVPLGKPKSGRVWKDRNKQRFSALLRDKPLRSSWQKKMEAKREKEIVKKYSQQLADEKARKKEEKRTRREENLRRRAENERKAEIVQVIRNTAKLKRMKKKQLRKIEKRDTLQALQKTPSAVKKASKRE
ncbi:coiled-coil domain-containing protein 86 [Electrophorus electricus]|uniref:Coiled-coil domain-containing protein 86 n=1 Tax=Electrophorus electricus TaxID=8005 RepID=A0A4W4E4M6_ELEEL|nr:coiled-coil domain-containing protein 86 [Electrophorus electricus]